MENINEPPQNISDKNNDNIRVQREVIRNNLFKSLHSLINKDSPALRALIRAIMVESGEDKFISLFRKVSTKTEQSKSVATNTDRLLAITDLELRSIYHEMMTIKNSISQENVEKIKEKENRYRMLYIDRINYHPLEEIKEVGLHVKINNNDRQSLQQRFSDYRGQRPILEIIKNEELLQIGRFKSKPSLLAHDWFDHLSFLSTLQKAGILNDYDDLIQELGDPSQNDIYSRYSERLATFGYQIRKMELVDLSKYEPRFPYLKYKNKLISLLEKGGDRFQKQINVLNNDINYKRFEFLFNEPLEEFVRENDKRFELLKTTDGSVFNYFDPRYIALIVEIAKFSEDFNFKDEIDKINIAIEVFLVDAVSGVNNGEIIFNEEYINNTRTAKLSMDRIEWIKDHTGFLTFKNSIL